MKLKVFISYHHENDQSYRDELVRFGELHDIFEDYSVDTGDISDDLTDEQIREKIRDEYIKDSTVTIVLVGTETKHRKHIDWEIYSSMHDGKINKKSGIIVINLPSVKCGYFTAAHSGEKENVFPEQKEWISINSRSEFEERYPYMPARIIDNLLEANAHISVISWDKLTVGKLRYMIECAYQDRQACQYNLSRPMRRHNS